MPTLRTYFFQLIVLVILLATLAYAVPRLAQVVSTVFTTTNQHYQPTL